MSNPYCLPELSNVPEDEPSITQVTHQEQEMRTPPKKKFLDQVVAFGKPIAIGVLIIFSSAAVLNLTSSREYNGGAAGMARVRRDAGMGGEGDGPPPVPDRAHDPTARERIIVYNSVPKSGSTTMRALIDRLKVTNDYVYMFGFHDIERKRYLTNIEEDVIARVILNVGERAIYNKEVFYVNFTKFGYAQPTYINTIRDPADRKISRYFHDRSESKHGKLMKEKTAEQIAHNNMTMEDCIRTQDIECTFNTKVMVSPNPSAPDYVSDFKVEGMLPYFCGNEYRCRFPYAGWTLNKAKESVERNYEVVGTLEDFDIWLQVIDYKLPQFFGGVYRIYKDEGIMANRADSKKPVSDETYETLKKKLRLEYDFYYWARARLFKQFAEIQEAKQKKGEATEEDVKTAKEQYEKAKEEVFPEKEFKAAAVGVGPN